MPQTLRKAIANQISDPNPYDETVIVSAEAPIVLSVWRGDPGRRRWCFCPAL